MDFLFMLTRLADYALIPVTLIVLIAMALRDKLLHRGAWALAYATPEPKRTSPKHYTPATSRPPNATDEHQSHGGSIISDKIDYQGELPVQCTVRSADPLLAAIAALIQCAKENNRDWPGLVMLAQIYVRNEIESHVALDMLASYIKASPKTTAVATAVAKVAAPTRPAMVAAPIVAPAIVAPVAVPTTTGKPKGRPKGSKNKPKPVLTPSALTPSDMLTLTSLSPMDALAMMQKIIIERAIGGLPIAAAPAPATTPWDVVEDEDDEEDNVDDVVEDWPTFTF